MLQGIMAQSDSGTSISRCSMVAHNFAYHTHYKYSVLYTYVELLI